MAVISYRHEVDGLRAIAVLAVMVFHLDRNLLGGGFVGVDVFFVVSGYLITSIAVAEGQAGSFSVSRFFQKRIARIFPLALFVTFAILCASAVVYLPQDLASAGAVAVAASLSIANLKFLLQGNYFEFSADAQPFLHYWSLSLEEQFYVLLPVVVTLAFRTRSPRATLNRAFLICGALSLAACVVLTQYRPTWAFFLLPTRAWELIAGCALALVDPPADREQPRRQGELAAGAGMALLLLSFVLTREDMPFPGAVAVVPVLGAALLLHRGSAHPRVTDRLLSCRPLVSIGKASYSLYLWHWPIYCFVDYGLFHAPAVQRTILKLVFLIPVALLSYRFLERPARMYFGAPNRQAAAYALFIAGVIAAAATGYTFRKTNYVSAEADEVANGGVVFNEGSDGPTVVLLGDSNGSMYGKWMREWAIATGHEVHVASVAAGNPLPGNKLYEDSMSLLEHVRPDVVVMAAAWSAKLALHPDVADELVDRMLAHSGHVILIAQPPILPDGVSRADLRRTGERLIRESEESTVARRAATNRLKSFGRERVTTIDLDPLFLDSEGSILFEDEFGRQLFQDRTHLSGYGADRVGVVLRRALASALAPPALSGE